MSSSSNAAPDAEYKRRTFRRRKAAQQDFLIGKVQDALEHAVTTGSHVKQACRKRQRWESAQQQQQQQDGESSNNTTEGRSSKAPPGIYFAEDLRLYGSQYDGGPNSSRTNPSENGYPMKPWPSVQDVKEDRNKMGDNPTEADMDSEWNIEYGDSIPPILFSSARLSQEDLPLNETTDTERHSMDWRTIPASFKSLQCTDISVPVNHVPRALLERCWTRAVQAASNVMTLPLPSVTTEKEPEPPTPNHVITAC
jgi:hypothetical protein